MVHIAIPRLLCEACVKTEDQPLLQQQSALIDPQVLLYKGAFVRAALRTGAQEKREEWLKGAETLQEWFHWGDKNFFSSRTLGCWPKV